MFDHYRKNHFYNENMQKYGNHSQYYKEDAYHYDKKNYLCQDYTSYSNANSYNYDFQPTFNNTKCFENSDEDQPYSTHSSFVPQNTSPHSRSSDFYSTPHCDQVDNTLLEFIREMQEENKISRKRIEENWAFLEEMKLEVENFRSEQEMEVFQKNSEFHGRKVTLSTLPTENPQKSKPSFLLPSLSEKQEKSNAITRVILGEESSNHLLEIFEENVERDENENEEELVCEGIPQLDDYKVPIPFPEALYSKTMLNSMNLEKEDKISLREMDEIISDISMLFVVAGNMFLKDQIEESYAGWQYEGEKEIHQGGKLLNVFDDKINAMECTDLIHDVKVSHENVINHIPLTFVNENLCLKNISFHPFMINENNINEENLEPIIIKIYFTNWHDHLLNSEIFYMNVMLSQCFMFHNSMLLSYILKIFLFTKWQDHFIEHEIISPIDIHSICPCFSYEFSLAQLKHKNSFRESYHYFMEFKNLLFLKSSCIGAQNMIIQSHLIILWAYICMKFSMKYKFIYMGIELLIIVCWASFEEVFLLVCWYLFLFILFMAIQFFFLR